MGAKSFLLKIVLAYEGNMCAGKQKGGQKMAPFYKMMTILPSVSSPQEIETR